jgi:hypothetical protein
MEITNESGGNELSVPVKDKTGRSVLAASSRRGLTHGGAAARNRLFSP